MHLGELSSRSRPFYNGGDTVRYITRSREVFDLDERANRHALRLKHFEVGPEHIFLGLLEPHERVLKRVFCSLDLNVDTAYEELSAVAGPQTRHRGYVHLGVTSGVKLIGVRSADETSLTGYDQVETLHVALALTWLCQMKTSKEFEVVNKLLAALDVSAGTIRSRILEHLPEMSARSHPAMSGANED